MELVSVLFWVLALVTAVSAVGVVVTQNIVRAAAWLLFALAGTAGVFFLLGADFVGATQLLVYVGGTLVLVVFGVMLTAQGPLVNLRISAVEWAVAVAVGLVFYGVLAFAVAGVDPPSTHVLREDSANRQLASSAVLGQALLGVEPATPALDVTGQPAGVAPRVRTRITYLLPFEIVSVHLLVVLVGAAYLARAKRRISSEATA